MQSRQRAQPLRWILAALCVLLVLGFAADTIWQLEAPRSPVGNASSSPSTVTPSASPNATETPSSDPSHSSSPSTGSNTTEPGAPAGDFTLPEVKDGMVPVVTKVPTQQKVVFLTIDDGANKTQQQVELLKAHNIKATLFLAQLFIGENPEYFKSFLADGSLIENHSISHLLNLIRLPHDKQKQEICQMSDYEEGIYGRKPVFFRPPGGPYTKSLRKAAAECGLKALIDWNVEVKAGKVSYQEGNSLQPGDIVLMHFRPEFPQDFAAFLAAQKKSGLKVVLLEDFLKVR
ncbi:polysaccharide deacetylase family protein [Psychromicrobium sp. YIM B11713]|uniref:polysaccharide deacetylase family protein n=1 Tax=Psychromicrobium sp. YIM B11713 TaxID=3145233 RepID=UPI00374F05C6